MNIIEVRDKLVEIRKENAISQNEIASKLGVGQNAISAIENRPTIDWKTLVKYANAIGVEITININYKK